MTNVYTLSVEHLPTSIRIDGVYSSERKAWERVEALYKKIIETISECYSIDNIQFAEFRGKSLTLVYRTSYNELRYIKYHIDEHVVY